MRHAAELARVPPRVRGRVSAFRPGGPYALRFADQPLIAQVGDTLFAHGGVLPEHTGRVAEINAAVATWLRGQGPAPVADLGPNSPIWTRAWAMGSLDAAGCTRLRGVLQAMGAKRLVVGHTVQRQGVTSACGGAVWRIDVGMAAHYGGKPAALEITPAGVKVIQSRDR